MVVNRLHGATPISITARSITALSTNITQHNYANVAQNASIKTNMALHKNIRLCWKSFPATNTLNLIAPLVNYEEKRCITLASRPLSM
jgi:hypothetical protein